MTDAPERIWFVHVGKNIVPNSKRTGPKDVEYIRADLNPPPEVVKELVGALRTTRDRLLSVMHSEFDGVWSEQDFLDEVKEADAALAKWEAGE